MIENDSASLGGASLEDLDRAPASLPEQLPVDYKSRFEALQARFTTVAAEKDSLQSDFDELKRNRSTIAELDKLIGPYAKKALAYM